MAEAPIAPQPDRRGEAGFTLAMFIMILAVMSIMMGVAVQTVDFAMRREREAELIFRGQQYVEAIRLFKMKYGRYPMRLKEIWEADPKVIRKKWKDPITDSESWSLVFLGQEGGQIGRQRDRRGLESDLPKATQTPGAFDTGSSRDLGQPGSGPGVQEKDGEMIGPIVGVHSTSCDESIKIFEGRTTYCEWRFVYREQKGRGGVRGRGRGRGRPIQGQHGGTGAGGTGSGYGGGRDDDGRIGGGGGDRGFKYTPTVYP